MLIPSTGTPAAAVAFLAEGVDRNLSQSCTGLYPSWSPSSRRAWIEIRCHYLTGLGAVVALLAEGVDRNKYSTMARSRADRSPSSRRAWIEISRGQRSD